MLKMRSILLYGRYTLTVLCVSVFSVSNAQVESAYETNLAGVFQGKTLFIQNPYNRESNSFCVDKVYINDQPVDINYQLSALKIDFSGYQLFSPVQISVHHADSLCRPVIINPEAVLFHTIFRFSSVVLSDSALAWTTKGEKGIGQFLVEKLENGIWIQQSEEAASGIYEGAYYEYVPLLSEGGNKFRIKYVFPSGGRAKYLYSWEVEYDHYPEPITFRPKSTKSKLILSESTHYEVYDGNQKMVLSGTGNEVDVRSLRKGEYVIYFNGDDPGVFQVE